MGTHTGRLHVTLTADVAQKSMPLAVAQSCAACRETACRCVGRSVLVATSTALICRSLSSLTCKRSRELVQDTDTQTAYQALQSALSLTMLGCT